MNDENLKDLARIRFERAVELQLEAENLLSNQSYKSANNRAFYAVEKAVKAALALRGKDSNTHNGVVRTFNMEFVRRTNDFFSSADMKRIQNIEKIRNASDYDDFYVASKAECDKQVQESKEIIGKVKTYLEYNEVL